MPFVEPDVLGTRKRSWEDDYDDEDGHNLYSPDRQPGFYFLSHQDRPIRKIQPLSKRARTTGNEQYHPGSPITHKRSSSQQLHHATTLDPKPSPRTATLTPCHICHRKPTKKSHLDSFAQCQGCGERTCFVCIRECLGWNVDHDGSVISEQEVLSRSFHMDEADDEPQQDERSDSGHESNTEITGTDRKNHGELPTTRKGWDAGGHRGVVCSRCCIERGTEGDIACLGCLSRLEGA